jgi:hypothetical protein
MTLCPRSLFSSLFRYQSEMSSPKDESGSVFMEVWNSNLEDAFDRMIHLVEEYPYIAMVTHLGSQPFWVLHLSFC